MGQTKRAKFNFDFGHLDTSGNQLDAIFDVQISGAFRQEIEVGFNNPPASEASRGVF
jgi:hypothetical protein